MEPDSDIAQFAPQALFAPTRLPTKRVKLERVNEFDDSLYYSDKFKIDKEKARLESVKQTRLQQLKMLESVIPTPRLHPKKESPPPKKNPLGGLLK